MVTTPAEHKQDALKLNPPQHIELFEITLISGAKVYVHNGREIQWSPTNPAQPLTFEEAFVKVSGVERNSGEERNRPTLTLGNPQAIFHVPVSNNHLDGADVIRYKIKPSNLLVTPPVYEKTNWYLAQVTGLGEVITAQLRSKSDRQETTLPPRQYIKPDFPSVTI